MTKIIMSKKGKVKEVIKYDKPKVYNWKISVTTEDNKITEHFTKTTLPMAAWLNFNSSHTKIDTSKIESVLISRKTLVK